MPSEHFIVPELCLVVSRGTGVHDETEHLRHMDRLRKDPQFHPDYHHLVDCRGFTRLDFTQQQFIQLSRQSIFNPGSRRVFVAGNDMHFGLSRMFAALREVATGTPVMVFRNMAEAVASLKLPPDFDPDALRDTKSGYLSD